MEGVGENPVDAEHGAHLTRAYALDVCTRCVTALRDARERGEGWGGGGMVVSRNGEKRKCRYRPS